MTVENEGKKYDLIASAYAEIRNSFATEQQYLDLLMNYLKPNSHILDIGCGSGFPIASYLLQHEFQITGIDGSKELLKIAKIKYPPMKTVCGDIRTLELNEKFDAVVEWWCLFHIPQQDHEKMILRFANWLKPNGILEFTTGDQEYEGKNSNMLNQELSFYSLDPKQYEKYLHNAGFKILLCESDQDQHLVWIAKYEP